MTEKSLPRDGEWPRGYEEHQLQQLRRLAALPLWIKLEWLEEAQRVAKRLAATPPPGESGAGTSDS